MDKLEAYLRETIAVDYFVRVVKREDGKPIVLSISPYGIPGDPLEFKVGEVQKSLTPTRAKAEPEPVPAAKTDEDK